MYRWYHHIIRLPHLLHRRLLKMECVRISFFISVFLSLSLANIFSEMRVDGWRIAHIGIVIKMRKITEIFDVSKALMNKTYFWCECVYTLLKTKSPIISKNIVLETKFQEIFCARKQESSATSDICIPVPVVESFTYHHQQQTTDNGHFATMRWRKE